MSSKSRPRIRGSERLAPPGRRRVARILLTLTAAVTIVVVASCGGGAATAGPLVPGTPAQPRVVIIAARDYSYVPAIVDLVPGESVVFQVVNGGVVTHEVVIGPPDVQDAWEAAEAAAPAAGPGSTPAVSVPPGTGGLRFVLRSGERVDVPWTVPSGNAAELAGWVLGCHIPGHWAEGMVAPLRFVGPDGRPLAAAGGEPAP